MVASSFSIAIEEQELIKRFLLRLQIRQNIKV